MPEAIPFNRPTVVGRELEYIAEALQGGHSSSDGPFTARVSEILREACRSREALLTTSCTDALEMAAMLLRIEPNDVVVMPSFTFTSTALVFARQGAKIRFCDIDPSTLGLDPADVESCLDESVKAIVTVHYGGVPSSIDNLVRLASGCGASLIEDNAHGLFATHRGKPLGSFGRIGTLSFHETKNFTCGEGGALLLNDERDIERAYVLRDKGANRKQFLDGIVDKYQWVDLGSSFGMSDILAAFLYGQLERAEHVRRCRRRVAEEYRRLLEPQADELRITLPREPAEARPADHLFYVLLPTGVRPSVIASMRRVGIQATFHYVPLHSSPAGRRFAERERQCPVTDDISGRLLRLPFYNTLEEGDIGRVVRALVDALRAGR